MVVVSFRQWVHKKEKDLFPQASREKRGTVSREVSRERTVLEGQYGWTVSAISI